MVDWEAFYQSFRQPDFIAGYEIQNHLGGGAFGEVYKARKHSIGKAYAVKFLKIAEDSKHGAIDRELEQVRLFASIDHPNLVTIEDMGVASQVPYLIMGYAGEETLARVLERRELGPARAMRYFVQVCRGVQALHDRRLAHFDLKPSNVFIKGDVARVGDYGLAKLLADGKQTLSFGRGTPQYMAPEMLRNRADHRADIYSLGVILYESLVGALPFGSKQRFDTALRPRQDDVPPSFPAGFPPLLAEVIVRCLRLDPEDRYDSVHEILAALGQTAGAADEVDLALLEGFERRDKSTGPAPTPGEPERTAPRAEQARPVASAGEFRTAAAELARGALGVARGVIAGVTGGKTPTRDAAAGSDLPGNDGMGRVDTRDADTRNDAEVPVAPKSPASPELMGDDVVSVQPLTIEEPPEPGFEPLRRPASEGRSSAAGSAGVPGATGGDGSRRFLLTAPYGPGGAGGTLPVPPSVEGGLFATLIAALTLGTEILGALITGPALYAVRYLAGIGDRLLRGVPAALGGLVKMLLFLLLFALLGAVVAFVILAGMTLSP